MKGRWIRLAACGAALWLGMASSGVANAQSQVDTLEKTVRVLDRVSEAASALQANTEEIFGRMEEPMRKFSIVIAVLDDVEPGTVETRYLVAKLLEGYGKIYDVMVASLPGWLRQTEGAIETFAAAQDELPRLRTLAESLEQKRLKLRRRLGACVQRLKSKLNEIEELMRQDKNVPKDLLVDRRGAKRCARVTSLEKRSVVRRQRIFPAIIGTILRQGGELRATSRWLADSVFSSSQDILEILLDLENTTSFSIFLRESGLKDETFLDGQHQEPRWLMSKVGTFLDALDRVAEEAARRAADLERQPEAPSPKPAARPRYMDVRDALLLRKEMAGRENESEAQRVSRLEKAAAEMLEAFRMKVDESSLDRLLESLQLYRVRTFVRVALPLVGHLRWLARCEITNRLLRDRDRLKLRDQNLPADRFDKALHAIQDGEYRLAERCRVIPSSIEGDSFRGFPNGKKSESMRRTDTEVRHGQSGCVTGRF